MILGRVVGTVVATRKDERLLGAKLLVVRTDAPWKTLEQFVDDLKTQPGRYNYGSSGNYGTMHVPMEMLKASAGFRMTHIPYTGAGPALLALLGGQVDAVATGPSTVAQQIKAGKLRALAHWGDKPLSSLPDVPSSTQSSYATTFGFAFERTRVRSG